MSQLEDPKIIENYNVLQRLQKGSLSVVYLVEKDGAEYAIKLLNRTDEKTLSRFRREASTLARLNHENLLKILHVGEYEGAPFLVMEFLAGDSLADVLIREEKLSVEKTVDIILTVSKALSELHKNSFIHRDIKPANIFILSNGTTKLVDLGLVGSVEEIRTETGLLGTPLYCSPEQSKILKRDVDYRSDLYSLGVTFFEALAGRTPFVGSGTEILQQHASRVAPDVREFNPEVRPAVAAIITKVLSKDPDDRYQSVFGFIRDLERLDEIDAAISKKQDPKLGNEDRITLTSKVKFVPRIDETKKLTDAWINVNRGNPGIVIVNGSSGSGKTRICEEFFSSLNTKNLSEGPLLLRSKCQFFDRNLPFAPIREAIDGLVEELEILSQSERELRVQAIKKAGQGQELHLLALTKNFQKFFPDVVASANGASTNLDGDREVFFNSIAEFFKSLARSNSIVFFLDDLQWLDLASQQLFQKIYETLGGERFFLLTTARNDAESNDLLQVIDEKLSAYTKDKILIKSFAKEQMAFLIAEYLGAREVAPSIVDSIYSKSSGNVFIAIEYLRAGLEQGFLKFENGTWHLNHDALEKIALADNVFSLILSRIKNSSDEATEVLQYAALYGGNFSASDIIAVLEIPTEKVVGILQQFSEQALIERISATRWKFIHDKITESIVSAISKEKSQVMCGKLALHLYTKPGKTTEAIFLAARLFAKSDPHTHLNEIIESQIEAGNLAFANFAYHEAYAFYRVAYDLIQAHKLEKKTRLFQFSANFAICASVVSDDDIATECSDLNIKSSHSKEELAKALGLKIWILNIQGKPLLAWEYFKQGCDLYGKPFPLYLHWKLINILFTWIVVMISDFTGLRLPKSWYFRKEPSSINCISQMYRDALLTCEYRYNNLDLILVSLRLLALGRLFGGPKECALGYSAVGYLYGVFGLKGLAVSYFNRAKTYCEKLNDPSIQAVCEMRRLMGSFYCGAIKDMQEFIKQRDYLHKYLSPAEYGRLVLYTGWCYTFRGLHEETFQLFQQILSTTQQKIARIAPQTTIAMLNQSWSQLSILGKNLESQKIKSVALEKNFEFRHNATILRSALNAEICTRKITGQLDQATNEILAGFWRRRGNRMLDPMSNNISSLMAYILIQQIEEAKGEEEKLSLRLELKSILRFLFLTLYCPLYRSNYYLLKGSYFRTREWFWLAQFYYKRAEKLAETSGNFRALFDIAVERARIFRKQNNLDLTKLSLSYAQNIALDRNWLPSITRLNREFGSLVNDGEALVDRTHGTSVTGVDRSGPGNKPAHTATRGVTHRSGILEGKLEESRVADILLRVSSAFVSSSVPIEQMKAVLNQIVQMFAAERGFIFIKDEASDNLQFLAGKNAEGFDINEAKAYSSGIVATAIREVRPVIITGSDKGELQMSESAVIYGLRSIMATPLVVQDRILGAVYVDSTLTRGLFAQKDAKLFATLASHISIALEMQKMARVELEKLNLKKELEIQTAVSTEAKKVALLVDHMQQALFSIDQGGTIIEPVSRYSENIFGNAISGQNIIEVLFKDLPEEKVDSIRTVLSTTFGEDELQWSLMEDNIPKKLNMNLNTKSLKILPSPIWDENEKLEKILFVIEDITKIELLENEAMNSRKQTLIIEDLLKSDSDELRDFLNTTIAIIENDTKNIAKSLNGPDEVITILRDLHSVKGNFRLFKLLQLSEQVHRSETVVIGLQEAGKLTSDAISKIQTELKGIKEHISEHLMLLNKLRPQNALSDDKISVSALAVKQLDQTLKSFERELSADQMTRLGSSVRRLPYKSIRDVAMRFEKMVEDISNQLSKKVALEVEGDALIDAERFRALQECFLHIIRNSIDHGIETPSERTQKSKPENGTIRVKLEEVKETIYITISDNGKGIDASSILKKAIEKKIVTPQEGARISNEQVLDLIFSPNFSTKDTVSDISGRGIGMDVVKQNMKNMGGDIFIKTKVGEGTQVILTVKQNNEQLSFPNQAV